VAASFLDVHLGMERSGFQLRLSESATVREKIKDRMPANEPRALGTSCERRELRLRSAGVAIPVVGELAEARAVDAHCVPGVEPHAGSVGTIPIEGAGGSGG
jgi:hypothetical protein